MSLYLTTQQRSALAPEFGVGETQTASIRLPAGTVAVLTALAAARGQSWGVYGASLLSEHAWTALNPDLTPPPAPLTIDAATPALDCNRRIYDACDWIDYPPASLEQRIPELNMRVLADAQATRQALITPSWTSPSWTTDRGAGRGITTPLSEVAVLLGVRAGWILGTDPRPGLPPLMNEHDLREGWNLLQQRARPGNGAAIEVYADDESNPQQVVAVFWDTDLSQPSSPRTGRVLSESRSRDPQGEATILALITVARALLFDVRLSIMHGNRLDALASGRLHPGQAATRIVRPARHDGWLTSGSVNSRTDVLRDLEQSGLKAQGEHASLHQRVTHLLGR